MPFDEVRIIIYGTIVIINVMFECKTSVVGFIMIRGFCDVIELGCWMRFWPYGLKGYFNLLILWERWLEVSECLDAEGEVLVELDEDEVCCAVWVLVDMGCESVVIHFFHSYINLVYECCVAEIVVEIWFNDYVIMGHVILSEYWEYECGVIGVVNVII